jgi:hypothetical protein
MKSANSRVRACDKGPDGESCRGLRIYRLGRELRLHGLFVRDPANRPGYSKRAVLARSVPAVARCRSLPLRLSPLTEGDAWALTSGRPSASDHFA